MDAVAAQLFGFDQGFLLAWVGVEVWGMGPAGRMGVLVGGAGSSVPDAHHVDASHHDAHAHHADVDHPHAHCTEAQHAHRHHPNAHDPHWHDADRDDAQGGDADGQQLGFVAALGH